MREPRRALRALVCGISLAMTFSLAAYGILRSVRTAAPERLAVNLNVADIVGRRLPELARNRAEAQGPLQQIVVFGDSAVVSYRPGHKVPERLEAELAHLAPGDVQVRLVNLAVLGVAIFDYYFLADRVIAAQPDGLLLCFNLDSASMNWRDSYSRPELAGFISPRRIFEVASLPIHWVGLTLDRLLFYMSIVEADGFDVWYKLAIDQARVGRARIQLRDWADLAFGGDTSQAVDQAINERVLSDFFVSGPSHPYFRYNENGVLDHYAVSLAGLAPDHPVLEVLGATVQKFERAGIPVLVYLNPVNVEHIEALGLWNKEGFSRTVDLVEQRVREAGGDFVDMHALFPDRAFRDGPGHFVVDNDYDGPKILATALGEPLLDHIRRRYRTKH